MGRHFLIDGWTLRPDRSVDPTAARFLGDPSFLASLLDELVERVGMTVLRPAEMVVVPPDPDAVDTGEDCGGTTGVVILTTSHASVHTWPLRGQVSFDLYSCRDFDPEVVLEFLCRRLRLSGGTWRSVPRSHDRDTQLEFRCADADATY